MPDKIKYSNVNVANSVRFNNVAIGPSPVDYGPTDNGIIIPNIDVTDSRTFWWNGITPPSGGYTIYNVKSDNSSPSIICPANSTELIYWANALGGVNISTVADALTYINTGTTSTVVVNKDYNIITSGLTFVFDASYTISYPQKNNIWYDVSGNASNATLINAPTWNSASPQYFNFIPSMLEYAETAVMSDLNRWTIEARFRTTANLNNQITSVVTNQFDGVNKLNFSMGTNNAPQSNNIVVGFFDGAWRNTTGFAPTQNVWYHVVGTYDGSAIRQYINGALTETVNYVGTPQSGGTLRIARRWDSSAGAQNNYFPGDIQFVRVYNRALSASEVTYNFNNI